MVEVGGEHGLDRARCLAGSRIDPAALDDPAAEIDAVQELAVARNLLAGLPHVPRLGAEAGRRHTLGSAGALGFALLTSATVRDAVVIGIRYARLGHWFLAARLDETRDPARIVCDDRAVPADVRGFLRERDIAIIVGLLSAVLGYPPPYRVDPLGRAVVLPRAILDLPLPQADPATARQCERQCRELLDRRARHTSTAARVRARIREYHGDPPPMPVVAAELHLDARTLRRRLSREGTSYRALLDEIRADLAVTLLAEHGLTVAETARRLGYADAASFAHAFTRWRGRPPGAFRAAGTP